MKQRIIELLSWEKIIKLFQNPRENPQETVLVAGIFIAFLLILLVVFLLVYSIMSTPPEEKERAKKKGTAKRFWGVVGLILLALGFGINIFFVVYSSQPSYCRSCHQMKQEYESWTKSSHTKVTCVACHQEPGIAGWTIMKLRINRMILLKTTKGYREPITTKVNSSSCMQCHDILRAKVVQSYGIKMSHKEPLEAGFRCSDCHNTVGHGKAVVGAHYPSMNNCIQCHTGEKVSTKCSLCHIKDIGAKLRQKVVDYPKVHLEPSTDCRGCHPIEKCTRCHGVEMPHPPDWTEPGKITHARQAAFEKKQICFRCHQGIEYCNSCHRFPGHSENWKQIHGDGGFAAEKACMSCHSEEMSPILCRLCH